MNRSPLAVATEVRKIVRANYLHITSCIESAYLFERTAFHMKLPARRVVAQVVAYSPLLAQAIASEDTFYTQAAESLVGQPGYWSVGVGMLQKPDDFVGRMESDLNRFVGHVVCVLEGDGVFALVDPSADQMSRPDRDLVIDKPIVVWPCENRDTVVTALRSGVVVRYDLHHDVAVPEPVTNRKLERYARGLARKLCES